MPSINDVLKEKFNVTGNNIAETLSKIEPGSGGGSGINNWLIVNTTHQDDGDSQYGIMVADKTARQIMEALPYVMFFNQEDSYQEAIGENYLGGSISLVTSFGYYKDTERYPNFKVVGVNTEGALELMIYTAAKLDDYPYWSIG